MSEMLPWIGAQAEGIEGELPNLNSICAKREKKPLQSRALAPEFPAAGFSAEGLASHQFPSHDAEKSGDEVTIEEQAGRVPEVESEEGCGREFQTEEERWEERRRARELERQLEMDRAERLRPYRGRTVKMLRRYLRTSIETGRLPSILGSAFFRSGVTCYSVVTFEDRVIFVHDMEICLEKLDEFSRQLIARCVLQEYSMEEAARLLQCDEKTIRRNLAMALDDCSEILLKMGLLEGLAPNREKSCQGGKSDEISASDC
jgi:hypothetical protein